VVEFEEDDYRILVSNRACCPEQKLFSFGQRSVSRIQFNVSMSVIQQALIIELHPKIMSVLRQKYHEYLFANARVLPIANSDMLEFEFIVEVTVTKGDGYETVQLTFRRDGIKGYRVDGFNVVSKQLRE
jgi:hypothetical protein